MPVSIVEYGTLHFATVSIYLLKPRRRFFVTLDVFRARMDLCTQDRFDAWLKQKEETPGLAVHKAGVDGMVRSVSFHRCRQEQKYASARQFASQVWNELRGLTTVSE